MSLSVKVFVKKAGCSDEVDIRRFSIDEEVCTSYDYLTAKIRATLSLADDSAAITLFWKGISLTNITFCLSDQ